MGLVLGDHFDQQVFVLKTALGQPSLSPDLAPPSSGKTGKSYTLFVDQVNRTMKKLSQSFPDYREETKYEFSGLVINIGEQDKVVKNYAKCLPLLIKDGRKQFKTPQLPVVIVVTVQG